MSKKSFLIIFFMVVAFLSGCAVLPSYRAEMEGRKMISDYPLNKAAVARAISEHRVIHGMTMEEVIESWGNPEIEHELVINGKVYYSWAYKKNHRTRILYFRHGILVDIK
ncbi:MAG: DUF2845 domain-containing protein [Candidatus Omnitrophica bacterium]|nr:DUF2845 domain-containing protein [Candidatus Omnitrophota bacterium]